MRAFVFYLRVAVVVVAWFAVTLAFCLLALPMWGSPRLAAWYGRAISAVGLALMGIRLDVVHRERLEAAQPCVYVANHHSNLDMFFLGKVFPPRTVIIGKRELRFVPLFGLLFVATRNILIDRRVRTKAIAGLDEAVAALRSRGDSIWIFPEGTRNRTGEKLAPFKKGAFHMAVEAQVPLVPVVLHPFAELVDMKAKRMRGGRARLEVLEPISTTGLGEADLDALRERTRQAIWHALEALGRPLEAAAVEPGRDGIDLVVDVVSTRDRS